MSGSPTVDSAMEARYQGARLFLLILTKETFTSDSDFPPAAAPFKPHQRLSVLPHKRAEQLSDSKQLRKYDQGTFRPFHICWL